jgi:hypothetical protein
MDTTNISDDVYLVLCMPWFQWWNLTTTPPTLDGRPRWNYYVDSTTGEETLALPPFMEDQPFYAINELKAGPYAFT